MPQPVVASWPYSRLDTVYWQKSVYIVMVADQRVGKPKCRQSDEVAAVDPTEVSVFVSASVMSSGHMAPTTVATTTTVSTSITLRHSGDGSESHHHYRHTDSVLHRG
jgi:hypothetical protein